MRASRLIAVWGGYPFVAVLAIVVTAALLPFRTVLAPEQIVLLYVPYLVLVGRVTGVRTAVAAAVLASLAGALFFIPPYGSLIPASPAHWVTLALFFGVALVAGVQTGALVTRERAALRRQRETALLNHLAWRLVEEKSDVAMARSLVHDVVTTLGAERAALYVPGEAGRATLRAEAGALSAGVSEAALAGWVLRHNTPVALPRVADPSADGPTLASVPADGAIPDVTADGVFVPLQTTATLEGVLYMRPLSGAHPGADDARQLIAVSNIAALFLARLRLEAQAAHASALLESDRLKSALVSSVSHELKTPLAAVTARVTGLLDEEGECDPDRVRGELTAVAEDLSRLDASIRDLIDVSRLESDVWRPRLESYEVGEILGTVAGRIPAARRSRVSFEIPRDLPHVRVDFSQIARAMSNLVDNALAYSPAPSPVRVGARRLAGEVVLWVEDSGPGVADEEKGRVFEKFFRGAASGVSPSGTGLGLAIVREIVRSHGGGTWVEDVSPHGARFVISLPVEEPR